MIAGFAFSGMEYVYKLDTPRVRYAIRRYVSFAICYIVTLGLMWLMSNPEEPHMQEWKTGLNVATEICFLVFVLPFRIFILMHRIYIEKGRKLPRMQTLFMSSTTLGYLPSNS